MDENQIKQIVIDYLESLEKSCLAGTGLRKMSCLPHSKGMIRLAILSLVQLEKNNSGFDDDQKDELVNAYMKLAYVVDDSLAEKYSNMHNDWQEKKNDPNHTTQDENQIKQYLAYMSIVEAKSDDLRIEMLEFIKECDAKEHRFSKRPHNIHEEE